MEPPLSAVGALAREGDEDRFLAALFAPARLRERLFALIALNLELAKIPAVVTEPILGEIRLAWWRDALDDLFEGGVVRGHEVIHALGAAHETAPLDRAAMMEMVEARALALTPGALEGEALDQFIAGTGGALARAQVAALGGGPKAVEVAALVGWAEGAGRLIAALPAIAASGAGAPMASGADIAALREGKAEAALRVRLAALGAEGRARLDEARRRRGEVPKAARAPLLSAHIAERTLIAAAAEGFDPFLAGAVSPFRARAALFLRAAAGRF